MKGKSRKTFDILASDESVCLFVCFIFFFYFDLDGLQASNSAFKCPSSSFKIFHTINATETIVFAFHYIRLRAGLA